MKAKDFSYKLKKSLGAWPALIFSITNPICTVLADLTISYKLHLSPVCFNRGLNLKFHLEVEFNYLKNK